MAVKDGMRFFNENDRTAERRFLKTEIGLDHITDEAKFPKLRGYAAVFNVTSEDNGGFVERILPGAFSEVLNQDVRALLNHDPNFVLGRTAAKTLEIAEDEVGLAVVISPPGVQWANDLRVSIDRGDINEMSFGFRVAEGGDLWERSGKLILRTISKFARLFDVSVVTMAAYPQTEVSVRSLYEEKGLDFDVLSRVLRGSQHGLEITGDEKEVVAQAISILQTVGHIQEVSVSKEEDRAPGIDLDTLRRTARLIGRADSKPTGKS